LTPLSDARALLFDLDGTLIESAGFWMKLLAAAARDLGYPPLLPENFGGNGGFVRRLLPRHSPGELLGYFEAHVRDHEEHLVVAEGVAEIFALLGRRGIASAVVTNQPPSLARVFVARTGVRPDLVVGKTDAARGKPAPDMVQHACARLGVSPGDAWLVGDSRLDREAARAAGARFVGVGIPGDLMVARLAELLPHLEGARA
jgi:phosphoglycolate phosphatase/AHBA synthesis associated protein